MSKAQDIYQGRADKGLELVVGFDRAVPIRDQDELADRIADLAARNEARKSGQIRRDALCEIPELSFAWLVAGKYVDPCWRVSQVYSTPFMSLERLKDIVKSKEAKSRGYRPCAAYWLLVVIDFIDSAQDQEIRIEGFDAISSKVFERILVYKTGFGQVLETGTLVGASTALPPILYAAM